MIKYTNSPVTKTASEKDEDSKLNKLVEKQKQLIAEKKAKK